MPEQDPLSADHEEVGKILDHTFAALERGDRQHASERLDYLWARLAMHIRAEHLHLFPALLKAASLDDNAAALEGVIEQLRADHNFFMQELALAVKTMGEVLDDDNGGSMMDLVEVKERMKNLGRRLITHNDIEESRVYPLVELLLSSDEAAEIRRKMKSELDNLPPRFIEDAETER